MTLGDLTILSDGQFGAPGSRTYNVLSGTTVINAGEPVARALGAATVTAAATNTPVVGTDYYVGVATTTSAQTATLNSTVQVRPLSSDIVYLANPKVAATWDTQAEYDALVGDRVLLDLTSGAYTILATDSANNGCVIQPLEVAKYPGKVAFAFRNGVSDLS